MMAAAVTGMNSIMQAHPRANSSSSQSGNTAVQSTISANDFLSLLVTEMKNQDPTAQTDPNEYVNQLVQVNSLEQLIEINENLTNALGGGSANAQAAPARASASRQNSVQGISSPSRVPAKPISAIAGNLGVSKPNPAAQR